MGGKAPAQGVGAPSTCQQLYQTRLPSSPRMKKMNFYPNHLLENIQKRKLVTFVSLDSSEMYACPSYNEITTQLICHQK